MKQSVDEQVSELFSIDLEQEIDRICTRMREMLRDSLRRRGLVLGISGGVDSAVCTALAVRAVGASKVFGLLMPEQDSSSESVTRGRQVAEQFGIEYAIEDIAPTLAAIGCYRWRDQAMQAVFPEYRPGWKNKIVNGGGAEGRVNFFRLVIEDDKGQLHEQRMGLKEYLQVVAATNFKQRIRKNLEFFHADRLNFAVIGTPNRLEYDQGFFVKNGDGSADLKPIAHLYKSQVYMLARHFKLPEAVCNSTPSTDTYSLSQGQDEFYFALPYKEMDIALLHFNRGLPASALACRLGLDVASAEAIYRDIESKRRTTASLHWPALVVEKVDGPMTSPPAA